MQSELVHRFWRVVSGVILALLPWGATIAGSGFVSNFDQVDLVDQEGQPFNTTELAHHVVLFSFIFTGCDAICPIQIRSLRDVFTSLPDTVRQHIRFVSISIDPGNDSPEKMKNFARLMQADIEGWFFLSGDVTKTQDIVRRLHLIDEADPDNPENHRTSLWLVDGQGRTLQRYKGNPPDKERLIKELVQVSQLTAGN